jgi:hypothetical protein
VDPIGRRAPAEQGVAPRDEEIALRRRVVRMGTKGWAGRTKNPRHPARVIDLQTRAYYVPATN